MKTTGYKLQHALRELDQNRSIAATQFSHGLFVFEGDETVTSTKAMEMFRDSEEKIARLQEFQGRYNLTVQVSVLGKKMTLSQAVKLVGGAGRSEKMWRTAAKNTGNEDHYGRSQNTRETSVVVAKRSVGVGTCIDEAKKAAKYASALREAIQVGNATEIDFQELSESDFE